MALPGRSARSSGVSAFDAREPQEAMNQQRATNEQHDGHRNLGNDERAANAMARVLSRSTSVSRWRDCWIAGISPNSRPATSATPR